MNTTGAALQFQLKIGLTPSRHEAAIEMIVFTELSAGNCACNRLSRRTSILEERSGTQGRIPRLIVHVLTTPPSQHHGQHDCQEQRVS